MFRLGKNSKLFITFALFLILTVLLAACGGDSNNNANNNNNDNNANHENEDRELADEQKLRFTEGDEIRSMDITIATDTVSHDAMNKVFSGLLIYENDELVPELAEDLPEVNDDNTEYVFTLRDGIEWHDGTPITADDFVYSWRRAVSTDVETQYAYIFEAANIENAKQITDPDDDMYGETENLGVEAVDDKTLKVTLDQPTPEQYFNSLMQFAPFFPLNEEFVEEQGDDYAQEPENLLFNGAYVMEEWNHGEGWTLVKNDNYWNADEVTIEEIEYTVVKDPDTALKLYESGEIDRVGLTSENVDKYENDEEFEQIPDVSVFYWDFNRDTVPEFENDKLRQAVFLAIDREAATEVILNNGSIPANYIIPQEWATGPDGKDFHDSEISDVDSYPDTDKEKAQELWEEAQEELGIDGLEVELMTTDGGLAEDLSEYFADQVESTLDGFEITINKQPFNSYLDLTSEGEVELAAGSGWAPDYEDPMTFLELFTTDNPQNTYGLSDETYDEMIEEASQLGDEPEKRWEVLQEAERYLIENALIVPTYQKGSAVLTKDYIDGAITQTNGIQFYVRYAQVYEE